MANIATNLLGSLIRALTPATGDTRIFAAKPWPKAPAAAVDLRMLCESCGEPVAVDPDTAALIASRTGRSVIVCDACSFQIFVCPRCESVSFNPNDAKEGYCARCKAWTRRR